MRSRIKTREGVERQLAAITTGVLQQRKRFDQNYGAMTMVMEYLPQIEQLRFQGIDKWQYNTRVSRVQVRLVWPGLFYLVDGREPSILAICETGESQRFVCRGEPDFSNVFWLSCQVGRFRLFQCQYKSYRILLLDPSHRSFTVEKSEIVLEIVNVKCLTNFNDQFVFLFGDGRSRRYSLARDRWEELPMHKRAVPFSACSLTDKVYVFAYGYRDNNLIHVLHNPGAYISSQDLHWQDIEVPQDVVTLRSSPAFVPLNSTEIAIIGGRDFKGRLLGDVITFDTSTCEFKKEMDNETDTFKSYFNSSVMVSENIIIALVHAKQDQKRLIKFRKGNTSVTNIQM